MFLLHLFRVIVQSIEARAKRLRLDRMTPAELARELAAGNLTLGELRHLGGLAKAFQDRVPVAEAGTLPPDATVQLPNGRAVRVNDIPRDEAGQVDPAWLDEHCDCGQPHAPTEATPKLVERTGMFL